MPLGYLGYAKLANVFLLANSSSFNRRVDPLLSTAVWGAGWYNAAQTTNYADSQQDFEGGLNFELQGQTTVWNYIRDWLIEQRAFAKSLTLSPNGLVRYDFTQDNADPRSGAWLASAAFTIDSGAIVTLACNLRALKRQETVTAGSYAANLRTSVGAPVNPLNPNPRNTNPFPGWICQAQVTWPGAPPFWATNTPQGMVLMRSTITVDNQTQVIRGCCLHTSRILTDQGLRPISSLSDSLNSILTEQGRKFSQGLVPQGERDTLTIRTRYGNKISVTPDHQFKVFAPGGDYIWKRADQLQSGDYLVMRRGHGGMIPPSRGGSLDLWYAVGHFYGDGGYLGSNRLHWLISEHELELKSLILGFAKHHTALKITERVRLRKNERGEVKEPLYEIQIQLTPTLFDILPAYKRKGKWRRYGLPKQTWSLGEAQLGALLRGLFSTDGTFGNNGTISFSSKFYVLSKDVRQALHLLGILSTVRRYIEYKADGRRIVQYRVSIQGTLGRLRFEEKVGFSVLRKQEALEAWNKNSERRIQPGDVTIPYAQSLVKLLFPQKKRTSRGGQAVNPCVAASISRIKTGKVNVIPETGLERILDRAASLGFANTPTYKVLRDFVIQDLYCDAVKSIKTGPKGQVYDIYNSETESYVAEGFVNHNCTGDVAPVAVLQGTIRADGSMDLWRDGGIPDPYGTPGNFTASGASVVFNISNIFTMRLPHLLLTSDAYDITGANNPVNRSFGLAGLGDGTAPPFLMDPA